MLMMGDEVRRTQLGNNNAYCQNNEVSWFDWSLCQRHADLHRFLQLLIQLRLRFATNPRGNFLSLAEFIERAKTQWHGVHLWAHDLSVDSHSLAATFYLETGVGLLCQPQALTFDLLVRRIRYFADPSWRARRPHNRRY